MGNHGYYYQGGAECELLSGQVDIAPLIVTFLDWSSYVSDFIILCLD